LIALLVKFIVRTNEEQGAFWAAVRGGVPLPDRGTAAADG